MDIDLFDEFNRPQEILNRYSNGNLSHPDTIHLSLCITYIGILCRPGYNSSVGYYTVEPCITRKFLYIYRIVYPLATFTKRPLDAFEGWASGVTILLLAFTGMLVPLFIPQTYNSIISKDLSYVPTPDQTASLWSLATFSFLDGIIFLGYRLPHITWDQLPPLADYDHAKYLKENAARHVDSFAGANKRHIFFNLLISFLSRFITMGAFLLIQATTSFVSPFVPRFFLCRVLIFLIYSYLETDGVDATMRPWFWISLLFIGPTASSIALQHYFFVGASIYRMVTQIEVVLTQLIYEQALRMRVKGGSKPVTLAASKSTPEPSSGAEPSPSAVGAKASDPTANIVGKINSMMTTDLSNVRAAADFIAIFTYIPLHIVLAMWFLYVTLGWRSKTNFQQRFGLVMMLALLPVPSYISARVLSIEVVRMQKTDGRVQSITETLNVLRMIKLFGWESKIGINLDEKREEELKWVRKRELLNMAKGITDTLILFLTMLTLVMKEDLTASKVFSSMAVFDILRGQLGLSLQVISRAISGKVSLDRINDFIYNTELLDIFTEQDHTFTSPTAAEESPIGFRDAQFTWSVEEHDYPDGGIRERFILHVDGEFVFPRESISLIVGPTGSGKTALLMALLGEMHFIPKGLSSWVNLPRSSGISYASQESWIFNDTIKENILFGSPLNETRYKEVIYQCGLEMDLSMFSAGDATEVGEKGITLSGGQKARITLARAIYSHAKILLLDDVFSALDVHTSKWIITHCFRGKLVKGRTILMVTHNLTLMSPIADFVLRMGESGKISTFTRLSKEKPGSADLALNAMDDTSASTNVANTSLVPDLGKGKLIVGEEIEEGRVNWEAFKLYLHGLGGKHYIIFLSVFISGLVSNELLLTAQTWYIGYWASQYDILPGSDVPILRYLVNYGLILSASTVIYTAVHVVFIFRSLKASRSIHKQLIDSLLGTTLRLAIIVFLPQWLDITPIARMIARCTQDTGAVDGTIPSQFQWLSEISVSMLVKLIAIVFLSPLLLGPGVVVVVLGFYICRIYMASQMSVKREMSNAQAPVIGHIGSTITGLISIRAYGAQEVFINEIQEHIDKFMRACRTFLNLNCWVTFRVDIIGAVFTTSVTVYLVYFQHRPTSETGFSMNMSITLSRMIIYWIMSLNVLEVQGFLERIRNYLKIEQEPKPKQEGVPPAYWPSSGSLRVENLSAKYSADGPKILHNLSFEIKSGERIGIVGRTGSGKSSLTLALLRAILASGSVYYDGISIDSINLDVLRSNITIIPQIPEMLSGSLRENLDPFGQFDDARLNSALRDAGLFSLQEDEGSRRITLDTSISNSGTNLSVGQRQILALARAIVKGSKLLILDEDHATDAVIQSSLRTKLDRDVTILTVAHRLHTIMDADRIMVIDAGKIVEFDPPYVLLRRDNGTFRSLVDESGDKEVLYELANRLQ
ncbi:hypothetical protein BDQ12DRAFT_700806 [Crucibulum laeve]|uniref:P-loop containing nucleoside triphosphate hydrolase protein n=1 Tax=Crucibulum laeve TaxID=68775 RepID=A0A5C3LX23_9AGAR|nr:hypothetical protein BDQ12DRAFT_700806 [Crucibulum laeve]